MRILIAPLNWGLGHASRCIPLIIRHLRAGDEVSIAGDGASLALLRKQFPGLPSYPLPNLHLQYSRSNRQVWVMLKSFPHLLTWAWRDNRALQNLLHSNYFDCIISDNRFGLFLPKSFSACQRPKTVYITHQLLIPLPRPWKCLQPLLHKLHLRVIRHYDECWIPDESNLESSLSGDLSHHYSLPPNARFIGALSRFSERPLPTPNATYSILAVLSGLEPQRTLLEEQIVRQWENTAEQVLIVRGKLAGPITTVRKGNITLVPYLDDLSLMSYLLGCKKIIARSGYSTIMDLHTLHLLPKATLIPTPGQPEQEYLSQWLAQRQSFVSTDCSHKAKATN